jgi:hypothetical protein
MFAGSTECVLFLTVLLSVNSEELFEVAATDFTADIVATQYVLAHSINDPRPVLNSCTR